MNTRTEIEQMQKAWVGAVKMRKRADAAQKYLENLLCVILRIEGSVDCVHGEFEFTLASNNARVSIPWLFEQAEQGKDLTEEFITAHFQAVSEISDKNLFDMWEKMVVGGSG